MFSSSFRPRQGRGNSRIRNSTFKRYLSHLLTRRTRPPPPPGYVYPSFLLRMFLDPYCMLINMASLSLAQYCGFKYIQNRKMEMLAESQRNQNEEWQLNKAPTQQSQQSQIQQQQQQQQKREELDLGQDSIASSSSSSSSSSFFDTFRETYLKETETKFITNQQTRYELHESLMASLHLAATNQKRPSTRQLIQLSNSIENSFKHLKNKTDMDQLNDLLKYLNVAYDLYESIQESNRFHLPMIMTIHALARHNRRLSTSKAVKLLSTLVYSRSYQHNNNNKSTRRLQRTLYTLVSNFHQNYFINKPSSITKSGYNDYLSILDIITTLLEQGNRVPDRVIKILVEWLCSINCHYVATKLYFAQLFADPIRKQQIQDNTFILSKKSSMYRASQLIFAGLSKIARRDYYEVSRTLGIFVQVYKSSNFFPKHNESFVCLRYHQPPLQYQPRPLFTLESGAAALETTGNTQLLHILNNKLENQCPIKPDSPDNVHQGVQDLLDNLAAEILVQDKESLKEQTRLSTRSSKQCKDGYVQIHGIFKHQHKRIKRKGTKVVPQNITVDMANQIILHLGRQNMSNTSVIQAMKLFKGQILGFPNIGTYNHMLNAATRQRNHQLCEVLFSYILDLSNDQVPFFKPNNVTLSILMQFLLHSHEYHPKLVALIRSTLKLMTDGHHNHNYDDHNLNLLGHDRRKDLSEDESWAGAVLERNKFPSTSNLDPQLLTTMLQCSYHMGKTGLAEEILSVNDPQYEPQEQSSFMDNEQSSLMDKEQSPLMDNEQSSLIYKEQYPNMNSSITTTTTKTNTTCANTTTPSSRTILKSTSKTLDSYVWLIKLMTKELEKGLGLKRSLPYSQTGKDPFTPYVKGWNSMIFRLDGTDYNEDIQDINLLRSQGAISVTWNLYQEALMKDQALSISLTVRFFNAVLKFFAMASSPTGNIRDSTLNHDPKLLSEKYNDQLRQKHEPLPSVNEHQYQFFYNLHDDDHDLGYDFNNPYETEMYKCRTRLNNVLNQIDQHGFPVPWALAKPYHRRITDPNDPDAAYRIKF